MRPETENMVRAMVATDPTVTREMLERAIIILRGGVETDEDMVHVMRRKDVIKHLSISRRTLDYYLSMGYLERVYGGGRKYALGVTRESVLRFLKLRVGKPAPEA